ncbi:hypothetical protein CLIB1444_10S04522 [[Candida] jaroonii]|uniref:Uncharacterized protein n=1 Tax=[Candida] jaroonii TaxID=467808 RepID=A0ACA9YDA1_9ASCO|nr:hypothetical protein CLIB1444_10S04522 [[Candida] jaroonii]
MNVTDRGYYTTTYLDNVNNRRKPRSKNTSSQATPLAPPPNIISPPSKFPSQSVDQVSAFKFFGPESPTSTQFSPSSGYSDDNDKIVYDPDELQEGITPAQLNLLQKVQRRKRRETYDSYHSRNMSFDDYDSYYEDNNHGPVRIPRESSRLKPTPKFKSTPKGFHGYYINQKKRYDDAEFYKPTNYTHKTFRDVFQDKDDTSGKYNPIEMVFDDPEKIKEQEENQKLKKAFKTIQIKLGKDDYDNYDYYSAPKNNVANEIFVTGESDDDSDYGHVDTPQDIDVYDGDKTKKKKKFKKLWKSKTKQIKKELGKDYFNNLEKQWELEAEEKKRKEKEKEKKQVEEIVESEDEDEVEHEHGDEHTPGDKTGNKQFYAGPKPEFHPAWNYLLSWLAYEQAAAPEQSNEEIMAKPKKEKPKSEKALTIVPEVKSIVPKQQQAKSSKPPAKKNRIKVSTQQLKNFNKNVSKMAKMWNLPASNLFSAEPQNSPQLSRRTIGRGSGHTIDEPLPQSLFDFPMDGDSQEFIVEIDSDEDLEGVDEELYLNPNTGQLEPVPPTSYSSMDPQMTKANFLQVNKPQTKGNLYIDTSNGAHSIISNINQLIKSIKIMKIIFAPIDIISESFPNLQTVVIMIELCIFMWLLYELSLLIDALCMMVKAVCAPMIAMGRFMNRIM